MSDKEDSGNTTADVRAYTAMVLAYGKGLASFEHICSRHWRGEIEVTGFSVRCPKSEQGEWLVVVRGFDGEGTPVVGFHSALTCGEAVAGAARRVSDGTIKFKVDEYRAGDAAAESS